MRLRRRWAAIFGLVLSTGAGSCLGEDPARVPEDDEREDAATKDDQAATGADVADVHVDRADDGDARDVNVNDVATDREAAVSCTATSCPTGKVCDPDRRTCERCASNNDAGRDFGCTDPISPRCDERSRTCVGCANDSDCVGNVRGPKCLGTTCGCNESSQCQRTCPTNGICQ